MNNFKDFRVAFLHSKFWTHNSLLVPNTKVILNEDFVNWKDLLREPGQIKHFQTYWFAKGISGEVCIPGQWNYAYIDGKFYHLVKMHSNGFVKGVKEEWFYYNVIYDDWQNDWLNNTFYLKGTLELTGDPQLALENIHQMSPILENVNGFRFLNGIERGNVEENTTVIKIPERIPLSMQLIGMSSADRIGINVELAAFHAKGELVPREDELWIPFMYKLGRPGNWKWNILNSLLRYQQEEMKVFDVTVQSVSDAGQAGKFRSILENMLGSNELYLASNNENRVYSFAKSVNPTKWIAEIDLSECTDITVLDRLRLTPLFGIENPPPKFTTRGFVDKICNKQGWPSSYKDEMIELFEDIVAPSIAPLISFDEVREKKIFRNVGIEKIDRDIVTEHDIRGAYKNPEWKKWAETRLVTGGHHKNHMWDNTSGRVYSVRHSRINFQEKTPEQINEISAKYRKWIETGKNEPSDFVTNMIRISPLNALVYLPDEYKLVSKDNNEDYLDFSLNNNEEYVWFALLPDYDRKTFTLGISADRMPSDYMIHGTYLDPKNPKYAGRRISGHNKGLVPFVIDEIVKENVEDVVIDWDKPSNELLKAYLNLGKDYTHSSDENRWEDRGRQSTNRAWGAEWLSKGGAFYLLSVPNWAYTFINGRDKNSQFLVTMHKHWNAYCDGKSYCDYSGWTGSPTDVRTAEFELSSYPESVYESDKREWRRFLTEYSFPVKTDDFSIMDILREFDDIPDNFLRWEVINTNIKKGTIKKYMRTIQQTGSGRYNATRVGEAFEKSIPKNTVVMIWLTQRPSGSPQGDRDFDTKVIEDYSKKYPKNDLSSRISNLTKKLYDLFFLTKWEENGTPGAIPCRLRNETVVNSGNYPKSGGRSQLSLSYGKPHKGIWYIAWIRFIPPKLVDQFRFTEKGYLNFNKEGTEDWIVAIIPNKYWGQKDGSHKNNAWKPRFTYREKASGDISRNTTLALIAGVIHNSKEYYSDNYDVYSNSYSSPATLLKWSNYHGEEGWKPANYLNDRFRKHFYNWETLLLNDFFTKAKTYKTARLSNPTKMPIRWKSTNPMTDFVVNITPLDTEIPDFMNIYLDLDKPECPLHSWERNDRITSKGDRIQLYKEKLRHLNVSMLQYLEAWNTWIKFEGTNWYASIKLNNKGQYPRWDFELFTNEVSNFKTREEKKWNFVNHKESDVDVLINTRSELNIYGNKFPLKSRKFSLEDELDVGLSVKPLDDIKQTEAAAWYAVTMNLNEQDILQTFIETPKELTKYSGFSAYEREQMIRQIGFKGEEYLYNMQMLEYQREENKFTNQYEKDWIYKEWKYDVARGATQIVGGVLDIATGGAGIASNVANLAYEEMVPRTPSAYEMTSEWIIPSNTYGATAPGLVPFTGGTMRGRFNYPTVRNPEHYKRHYFNASPNIRNNNLAIVGRSARHAGRAAGGLGGIVGGALTIAEAYETFNIKDEYRKQKYAMAEKKLAAEGDILNKRHEFERKNLLDDLWAMSANVHYPQLNANIVYKLYNKHMGIRDIHMVQYYPKGKLLEYIKNYYKEFGYNIMVRNFECTGAQDVKKHLRYQFIYEINHPNICAQEMIRARALAGIKVVEWVQ